LSSPPLPSCRVISRLPLPFLWLEPSWLLIPIVDKRTQRKKKISVDPLI
jgi:hypothetical protein